MSTQAFVLACALQLLERSAERLPPIRVVIAPPVHASPNAQGFLDRREGAIYLIASAPAFRVAEAAQRDPRNRGRCVERVALKMIASIIVHEEWHLKHGPDEKGAYQAQIMELHRLRLGPDTTTVQSVKRAMQTVLNANARRQRATQHIALVVPDH
jgi:hypothetical protein